MCCTGTQPCRIRSCHASDVHTKLRWLASPDDRLTEGPGPSGICWRDDFERYLQYLLRGLATRARPILDLFSKWDDIFFAAKGGQSSLGYAPSLDGAQASLDEALAELDELGTGDDVAGSVADAVGAVGEVGAI